MQVTTSAPGKVFVAGEYAVLQGAPAICIGINRRATVSISRSDAGTHSVSSPGYRSEEVSFKNVAEIADDYRLLASVWEQFPTAAQEPLRIEIDTRSFYNDHQKLGIGSSAAATVALSAAFGEFSGARGEVGRRANAAHRKMQNGRGSGADVATSVHGGVIEYRMHESKPVRLDWPKELHYALLWSGRSSSTPAQLRKLDSAQAGDTAVELEDAAQAVAVAWRTGAAQLILVALREFAGALRRFDDEHQLDIFAAGHATLRDLAPESGLVYKPCGAGGGDFGIAVADDLPTLHEFVATAKDKGFVHSEMAIDPDGLMIERGTQ